MVHSIVTSGRGRVNIVCEDTSCLLQSPAAGMVGGDQKNEGYCVLLLPGCGEERGALMTLTVGHIVESMLGG